MHTLWPLFPDLGGGEKKAFYVSRNTYLSFDASMRYCKDFGMDFASFDSYNEAVYFTDAVHHDYIWIGAKDTDNNGQFVRMKDGVDVRSILPWQQREPSGAEFCVHLSTNKRFNDFPCFKAMRFACEMIEVS